VIGCIWQNLKVKKDNYELPTFQLFVGSPTKQHMTVVRHIIQGNKLVLWSSFKNALNWSYHRLT